MTLLTLKKAQCKFYCEKREIMIHKKIILLFIISSTILFGCSKKNIVDKHTLRISEPSTVQTLDSTKAFNQNDYSVIHLFSEGLYDVDKDFNVSYALASKHKVSKNGLVHTFTIKEDAHWSNGDPITSNDFIYSWKRALILKVPAAKYFTNEGINLKGASELLNSPDKTKALENNLGIKKINNKKFEITLTKKISDLKSLLLLPVFYPLNQKFVEKQGSNYATSPETLLSCSMFKPNSITTNLITLERNPKYNSAKLGNVENITLYQGISYSKTAKMFDKGLLDYCKISSDISKKYQGKDVLKEHTENIMSYLIPNLNSKYLNDINIRTAISEAIDRKRLVNLFNSETVHVAEGLFPKAYFYDILGNPSRSISYNKYNHSIKDAKKLVSNSLEKNKIELSLVYANDDKQIATLIKKQIDQISNIKIKLIKTSNVENYISKNNFDLALTTYAPVANNGFEVLNYIAENHGYNYGHYNSVEYNTLLNIAKEGNTDQSRLFSCLAAERIAIDDMAIIPLIQKNSSYLMSTDLQTMGADTVLHYTTYVPQLYKYAMIKR